MMDETIPLNCPQCDKGLRVLMAQVADVVACPHCGGRIVVGMELAARRSPVKAAQLGSPVRRRRWWHSRRNLLVAGAIPLVIVVWVWACAGGRGETKWRSALPGASELEGRLLATGWAEEHIRPGSDDVRVRERAYTCKGAVVPGGRVYTASLEMNDIEGVIVRLQLRGYGSNIDKILGEFMPREWNAMQRLPGEFSDYMAALTTPHVIGDLAVTMKWFETLDVKVAHAFIIWPRAYRAERWEFALREARRGRVPFPLGLLVVLVAWFVASAFIGGKCAESRNRVTAGRVLGLFLGPLGWVISLFLPPPLPEHREHRSTTRESDDPKPDA